MPPAPSGYGARTILLTCAKVASVEKDACPRLAGVAGDERAGDRRRHHHVTSHADAEGQAPLPGLGLRIPVGMQRHGYNPRIA
jgi:hypothetical protein